MSLFQVCRTIASPPPRTWHKKNHFRGEGNAGGSAATSHLASTKRGYFCWPHKKAAEAAPPPRTWRLKKKGVMFGRKKRRRQRRHLAPGFKEKGNMFFGNKKNAGGSAATSHLAFKEKGGICFAKQKMPEAVPPPRTWPLWKEYPYILF